MTTVCVLAGGVGAAKFLAGLVRAIPPADVTAVVNVADDTILHGLYVCPDLDTCTYTLADEVNPETGWGLRGESWQAMAQLSKLGGSDWFKLGDRDLGTHLYRTGRMVDEAPLSTITAEITEAMGLGCRLLPATDDTLRTMVTLAGGEEVDFQTYFVGRQHQPEVESIRFEGWPDAVAGPGVVTAISEADVVVIAPSNPVVSIGPILAVRGIEPAITAARERVVAVSPIVAGAALKGPADRLLAQLGHEASVVGIARLYASLCSTLVIDEADADLADDVEAEGVRCVVTDTIMRSPDVAADLARTVIGHLG